jgi:hypothetical protein
VRDWAEQIGEIPEPWEELRAAGDGSSLELPRWEEHGASRGGRLTAADEEGGQGWARLPVVGAEGAIAAGGYRADAGEGVSYLKKWVGR